MAEGFGASLEVDLVADMANLMSNSFDDYLAGRVLINNGLVKQGITLASSAIEKYLKVFMKALGINYRAWHLDSIDKAKAYLHGTSYETIFNYFDPTFLEVLIKAYRWRYYDNIRNTPETIGFFINQFLGELDHTYYKLDSMLHIPEVPGVFSKSAYKRAIDEAMPLLLDNNIIAANVSKEEYMTRPSQAFIMHYRPSSKMMVLGELKQPLPVAYDGRMFVINVRFENDPLP